MDTRLGPIPVATRKNAFVSGVFSEKVRGRSGVIAPNGDGIVAKVDLDLGVVVVVVVVRWLLCLV